MPCWPPGGHRKDLLSYTYSKVLNNDEKIWGGEGLDGKRLSVRRRSKFSTGSTEKLFFLSFSSRLYHDLPTANSYGGTD